MFGRTLRIMVLGVLTMCGVASALPPGNDFCGVDTFRYYLFQYVPFEGNTATATTDGTASCRPTNSGKDVWHAFIPPCDGFYRIETCGSGFDVVLSVHSGCPGTSDNTVACLDDGASSGTHACPNTLHPAMNLYLERATTYYIRVAGYGTSPASGQYRILVTPVSPAAPTNDTCETALPVSEGVWPFSTCSASTSLSSSNACLAPDFVNFDVWYRYTAACDGEVSIDTCNSNFDTVMMVFPGDACPNSLTAPLACNDDIGPWCGPTGAGSRVIFPATSGEQFLIRVASWDPAQAGSGSLSIYCTPTCPQCPADYNEDGGVDGADVDAFFADWEQGLPCADVSGDGGVDGSDVAYFFIFWENGGC